MSDPPPTPVPSAPHPACLSPEQLLAECTQTFTRRSGPGGQNRNKVETAVVLRHGSTGMTAEANERRSQQENRMIALQRLRVSLAIGVRSDLLAGTCPAPSPLWLSRCRGSRLAINPEHVDFPALLAEALDAITTFDYEPRPAAEALGCSASQLVKLVQLEPRALVWWNARRQERGRHRLH